MEFIFCVCGGMVGVGGGLVGYTIMIVRPRGRCGRRERESSRDSAARHGPNGRPEPEGHHSHQSI